MLKRLISVPTFFLLMLLAITGSKAEAQCTNATVNWDNLDYYWNSGGSAPYASYITSAKEQTQKFAIGPSYMTIGLSNSALMNPGTGVSGENTTNTAEAGSYGSGADVQYIGDGTITFTFTTAVSNLQFSLYDIDRSQRVQFGAVDGVTARNITLSSISGSVLSFTNNGATNARVDATTTTVANTNTDGTVNVDIAGPVTSVTITISNTATCSSSCGSGGNESGIFFLSDITACVTGSFPTNWHQGYNNRPFVGPTQNQPDYFLVTPDNKSVYMMDPATGRCYFLFSETASAPYVNSLAYDPETKYLWYVLDGSGTPSSNRALKRYDFNTEAAPTTIIADITTSPLNIPTFDQGVESAGAAFYNGKIYFGVEGGRSGSGGSTVTRETMIFGIELDGSNNPVDAYQVFATDAYKNGSDSTYHDWADFILRDGMVYNFNTARAGSSPVRYKYSAYHHYNMQTGNLDAYYVNPVQNNTYTGQAGMNWQGQLFFVRDSVGRYFEDGTNALPANRYRAVVQTVPGMSAPPAWVGGAGDASDPFRPKCDFGDAPASYDPYVNPAIQSPAVHERSELIRLGATWDREFLKRGVTGTNDVDDGIAYTPIMPPTAGGYLAQVSAFNNSGSAATLIAWLDYNGNGLFDASEAITPISVPSSASSQNFWLFWPSVANSFVNGQYTYLRVRITAGSAGMTTSHSTGYFTNGEVEDYRVLVDNFPLATSLLNFNATLQSRRVKLDWAVTEQESLYGYEVERSADNITWTKIGYVNANGTTGTHTYQLEDAQPLTGTSYYRLRIIEATGMNRFSPVRKITLKGFDETITIQPNPASKRTSIKLEASEAGEVSISIVGMQGNTVLTTRQAVNAGANTVNVDLPETMTPGTYFIMITNGEELSKKKFIKIK
jgi:hypothetical protein